MSHVFTDVSVILSERTSRCLFFIYEDFQLWDLCIAFGYKVDSTDNREKKSYKANPLLEKPQVILCETRCSLVKNQDYLGVSRAGHNPLLECRWFSYTAQKGITGQDSCQSEKAREKSPPRAYGTEATVQWVRCLLYTLLAKFNHQHPRLRTPPSP